MRGAGGDRDGGAPDRLLIDQYLQDARRVHCTPRAAPPLRARVNGEPLDPLAVRQLVEPHLFFVLRVAWDLRGCGVPVEDLVAEGNIGLVEAAHRYNPGRQATFLTYAAWWIRKRIFAYLAREQDSVRLTRYARDLRRELGRRQDALRAALHREPTDEELAAAGGFGLEVVRRHARRRLHVHSIDEHSAEGPWPAEGGQLADATALSPEELLERRRVRRLVRRELAQLPLRERRIIENRFGIGGGEALTLQQLGDLLGVSRERARQLEATALSRLRRRIARERPRSRPR